MATVIILKESDSVFNSNSLLMNPFLHKNLVMTGWKKNLGTSLTTLGTSLMGTGIVPQLNGNSSKFLTYMAASGFVLQAVGQFFNHLFAGDQAEQQSKNTSDIANNESKNPKT